MIDQRRCRRECRFHNFDEKKNERHKQNEIAPRENPIAAAQEPNVKDLLA
jgi:hypothetical protein